MDSILGRPKHQLFDIKKNRTRWTIRPSGGLYWRYLPFRGTGNLRQFMLDMDTMWNPVEDMSRLIRGEIIIIKVPINREPHFKAIYKKGAEANPYKKCHMESIRSYIWKV